MNDVANTLMQVPPETAIEIAKMQLAGTKALSAAIAMLSTIGAAIGLSNYLSNYVSALARNPGAREDLGKVLFIGLAFIEAIGIFALAIALINQFVVK